MYDNESSKLKFILAVLMLLMAITQVRGQTASEIVVGTTTVKPTIDGQWQHGEWDNAIEYELTQGSTGPIKVPSYFRMMHDADNLYGILDVPSDNGTQYINANGDLTAGGAFLAFYYGASLNPNNQTQIFSFFEFGVNQTTERADVTVVSPESRLISSRSQVATVLSTTIHSSSLHRIWEFSIPIHPYVIEASLDTNQTMGFDLTVIDSSGNQLSLVSLNQHATITFVGTPVPEIISGQITLSLALLTPLIMLFAYHHRKLGNHS
ncbi:MAG TPA: hypothetical protein VJZ03_03085 [Candidatus Bathyarchaeia archaeon]|nr:hypothetical protein [Candidatus Bathyarchaeia archaeon]